MTVRLIGSVLRRSAGLSIATVVVGVVLAAFASAASASTYVPVPESSGFVYTGLDAQAGKAVTVTSDAQQIWAGVWFTGWNGPQGWVGKKASSAFPWPGQPPYGLLAKQAGQTFWVGTGTQFTAPGTGAVYLQINDDKVNNGAGQFGAYVSVD